MELRSRFVAELRSLSGGRYHDLSPSKVSQAVRQVLGMPGAGIVMLHRLVRLPVGASGDHVPLAERLQVTLGEGPCLSAAAHGRSMASSEEALALGWPLYTRALAARTPFRSILSFPLSRSGIVFGALDAYSTEPEPPVPWPLEVIESEVMDLVAALLLAGIATPGDPHGLAASPELEERYEVYVALGMVMQAGDLEELDALAFLRAYAFRSGTLLDTVAARMVGGSLGTAEVLGTS